MSGSLGFIVTRHVNSELTNNYWNNCVKLLRTYYPDNDIVIIDDNSDYNYVKSEYEYKNLRIIQSEYPRRGELLPYFYLLKYKFFDYAVIIHDSVFFHKRVNFELLKNIDVLPLWYFNPDTENIENTKRIIKNLRNNTILQPKLSKDSSIMFSKNDNWFGCFGVQSYIKLSFLEMIEEKYGITHLILLVKCRYDRCCLERIFGCIFFTECNDIINQKSLFGNIMNYQVWGYNYHQYLENCSSGTLPQPVIKVWTGR